MLKYYKIIINIFVFFDLIWSIFVLIFPILTYASPGLVRSCGNGYASKKYKQRDRHENGSRILG